MFYDDLLDRLASWCRPDLFVLLGAGASVPGMLSVADVTAKLRTWPFFREPPAPDAAPSLPGPLLEIPSGDLRMNFFEALHTLIASGLRSPEDAATFLHFERLVHAAELLGATLSLPPNATRANDYRFLLAPLLSVVPTNTAWNIDGSYFSVAAHEACYQILSWFKDCCDNVSTGDHAQARALRRLARRRTLRVFSLNYDDIPQASGIDFYTGFEGRLFRPRYPWPRARHVLCQLHGSVRFGTGTQDEGFDVVCLPSREEAAKARRGRGSGPRFQDGHAGSSAPMITGLRKADKTMSRPFGTYMHVMRDELLRCPHWLIVGYGFGDTHINEAMRQARANWQHRGRDVRAVIVNYLDLSKLPTDENDDSILDAWLGSPGGDVLGAACGSVFAKELYNFQDAHTLPKLDRSLWVPLGSNLVVHLGGTSTALGRDLDRVETFLAD